MPRVSQQQAARGMVAITDHQYVTYKGEIKKMPPKLINLYWRMMSRYGKPIGRGAYRFVFRDHDGRCVIKIPRGYNQANQRELDGDERVCPREHQAACARHWELTAEFGVLIIKMEWVDQIGLDIADWKGPVPEWVTKIDDAQVGHNKQGRLVSYDYAD